MAPKVRPVLVAALREPSEAREKKNKGTKQYWEQL
jgi:hypothetical protein